MDKLLLIIGITCLVMAIIEILFAQIDWGRIQSDEVRVNSQFARNLFVVSVVCLVLAAFI